MPLRLIFLGTPPFAVASLEALVEAGMKPQLVVTRPDRPRGRGLVVAPSAVRAAAQALGLPAEAPPRFHDPAFLERLRALEPDLFVLVAYGVILRPAALSIPRLGCINLHASLLPRWRGTSPITWQILAGDTQAGVSTQWIDAGVDTGTVIHREALPMPEGATTGSLTELLAERGARLLVRTLRDVEAGRAPREPQDESAATHAPRLEKSQGWADWERPAGELEREHRAFDPWPGLKFRLGKEGVRMRRAAVIVAAGPGDVAAAGACGGGEAAAPGEIVRVGPDGVEVAAGAGSRLLLQEVQPDGKRAMAADAWARGRGLKPGDRLGGAPEA